MSFASEMAEMAHELLVEFGAPRKVKLTSETPTGTESAPGIPRRKDYDVIAVIKLIYRAGFFDTAEQGTLVDDTRREIVLSTIMVNGVPLPVPPKSGDKITFDNYAWTIDAVGPVSPGGEVIIYKLEVKR